MGQGSDVSVDWPLANLSKSHSELHQKAEMQQGRQIYVDVMQKYLGKAGMAAPCASPKIRPEDVWW